MTHAYWFRATGGYICGCGRPSNLVSYCLGRWDPEVAATLDVCYIYWLFPIVQVGEILKQQPHWMFVISIDYFLLSRSVRSWSSTTHTATLDVCYIYWLFPIVQVGEILKQHHIQPHWMFALDTLLRAASQVAISILTPDLAANIIGEHAANAGNAPAIQQEEESNPTSGVSTFDSSNRPPELSRLDRTDSHRDLVGQIRDLEEENKRWILSLNNSN